MFVRELRKSADAARSLFASGIFDEGETSGLSSDEESDHRFCVSTVSICYAPVILMKRHDIRLIDVCAESRQETMATRLIRIS